MDSQTNRWIARLLTLLVVSGCGAGSPGGSDDAEFSLGGDISGLTGAGLLLHNNGGSSIAIINNGDFEFSNPIDDGTSYNVVVASQPAGQVCAVGNGIGTVSGGDVDNITVTCSDISGSWGTAGVIETDDIGHSDDPRADIDGLGNAIVVWTQDDGSSDNLLANRYIRGGTWGLPMIISDDGNANDVFIPQLAMDDAGNAIAVWRQHDGTRYSLWGNRYQFGVGWGTPGLLELEDGSAANLPQIAMNRATGEAIVAWLQGEPGQGGTYVWVNHFSPLTMWSGPQRIENLGEVQAINPQIAINDAGAAVAVWENIDGEIRSNYRSAIGGWGTPVDIGGAGTNNGSNPDVAIDPDGNAVAVWEDAEGAGMVSIRGARYLATSAWQASQTLEPELNSIAYAPRVAMDNGGDAIAVWYQSVGLGYYRVYANQLPVAGAWGAPQLISDDSIDDDVHPPSLAVDDAGNAMVVYLNSVNADNEIFAVRYQQGLGWLAPESIDATPGQARNLPVVAINASGNAVAAWNQRSNSTPPFDTWANLFE